MHSRLAWAKSVLKKKKELKTEKFEYRLPLLEKDYKYMLGKGQLIIVSTWDRQEWWNYSHSEGPTVTQYRVPVTRQEARHSG